MNTLPFSRKNNVAICHQNSNKHAPYCGVRIVSILSHASDDYNYDIVVLRHDLTDKTDGCRTKLCRSQEKEEFRG